MENVEQMNATGEDERLFTVKWNGNRYIGGEVCGVLGYSCQQIIISYKVLTGHFSWALYNPSLKWGILHPGINVAGTRRARHIRSYESVRVAASILLLISSALALAPGTQTGHLRFISPIGCHLASCLETAGAERGKAPPGTQNLIRDITRLVRRVCPVPKTTLVVVCSQHWQPTISRDVFTA